MQGQTSEEPVQNMYACCYVTESKYMAIQTQNLQPWAVNTELQLVQKRI